MELHYIHHSCFGAEAEGCLVVYDYWQDPEGLLPPLLDKAQERGAEVFFVVSHFHDDHYCPSLPDWCRQNERFHLIPSYDTVRRRHIDKTLPLAVLRYGERVETPYFTLRAYRSTDVGVSTVTRFADGTTLFHAGDCNNWYFPQADPADPDSPIRIPPDQMEKLFLSILRDIRQDFPHLDHALFPVDPRIGQEMLRGPLQLLRTIDIGVLHPMHYCL